MIPKVIVKNGKRYVKIGKKRIKVDSSLSERELIKWMIKYLKPKRGKRKKQEDTWAAPPPSKTIVLNAMPNIGMLDAQRMQAREIEATQKRIKESEDSFKKIADSVQKSLDAPKRPAIQESKEEKEAASPKYSDEQIEQGIQMLKDRDADLKRSEAIRKQNQENADKKVKNADQKAAAEAIKRRAVERDRIQKEKNRIESIMKVDLYEEIKKKAGGWNKLKTMAAKHITVKGSQEDIIDALLAKKKNLVNEVQIRAALNATHGPDLAMLQKEMHDLDEGDEEDQKIIAGEGRTGTAMAVLQDIPGPQKASPTWTSTDQ